MNKETEQQLTEELFSTLEQFRCVDKGFNRKLDFGQKPVRMLMMIDQLTREGPISISVLKEHMHISAPAITQFVNILRVKGYVMKVNDPQDKRKSLIELSDKGKKELLKSKDKMKVHMSTMVRHLGEQDTRTLNEILNRIVHFYIMEEGARNE